jgi:hypothetical protein
MADLTLSRYELHARPLPAVCACCGDPVVAVWKQKTFSWYPRWVFITILAGLLIFAIVAMVTTKKAAMAVPLCLKHKNHFLNRALLGWLGFAGILFVAFVCGTIDNGAVWMLLPIYILAWIIVVAIAGSTAIRATEITEGYASFKNLSPAFVAAHQALGPMPMPMPYGVPVMMPR